MTERRILAALGAALGIGLAATASAQITLLFPAQTVETSSAARSIDIGNIGTELMRISTVVAPPDVAVTHGCDNLAAGASCPLHITFAPASFAGAATASQPVTRTINVGVQGHPTPVVITVSGTAEKAFTTHFYRSILGREPDAGGKAYWNGEAERVQAAGADVNEAWYALASYFFNSPEYLAGASTTRAYVLDLFRTFLGREPDLGGLLYWIGQIDGGMPREMARASLMFSPEFIGLSQRIYGARTVRGEANVVMDFYRGLLARLPDAAGYAAWIARFRAAQCAGVAAVNTEVEAISTAFLASSEYAARNRTNAQYVSDLYDAFMRRGGDLGGAQYWIGQLNSGTARDRVRREFMASPEFRARVAAIAAESCMPA